MFKGWLFNLVGIVFAGAILDMVLPEGKTNQFIKHVFSVFVLYVIILPISTLSLGFKNANTSSSNLIYFNNLEKIANLQNEINANLLNEGIENCNLIINANYFEEDCVVNSVFVDFVNVKYGSHLTDSKAREIITLHIVSKTNIDVEDIVFYG